MNATPYYGPRIDADGVTFRLWAPAARRVVLVLVLDRIHGMCAREDGWFELAVAEIVER